MDETTDAARLEQVSVVIRTVNLEGEVSEDFVGFFEAEKLTGRGLADLLLTQLELLGLDVQKCRGQGYDGAATMQGYFNGVQAVVREREPLAAFVHCFTHRLNLAVSRTCDVPEVKNFFGTLGTICAFVLASPKRTKMLEAIIDADETEPLHRRRRLKTYCPTRWVERHTAVATFDELLRHLVELLRRLSTESDANTSASARAFLTAMNSTFCVVLACAVNLMGLTAPLSRGLQDSSIHLGDAVIRVNAVILALETRRNDEDVFTDIFNEASKTAHLLGIDLNIPRRANC